MQTTLNILETVLLVLAILVALGLAATIAIALLKVLRTKRDGKKDPDGELELTNLDKELSDRVREVKRSFLSEKQRKKLPKALLNALPAASIYAKVKFASLSQQTAAKNTIAAQWPSKVGS